MRIATTAASNYDKLNATLVFAGYGGLHAAALALSGSLYANDTVGAIIWLPVGLLFSALLFFPRDRWLVLLGATLVAHIGVRLMQDASGVRGPLFDAAATIGAALVAVAVMGRRRERLFDLASLAIVSRLLVPAALCGALCAAFLGATGGAGVFVEDWWRWLIASFLSFVVVAPFVLSLARATIGRNRRPEKMQILTGLVLLVSLAWVSHQVFGRPLNASMSFLQMPVVLLPILAWAIFGFGVTLVTACNMIVAMIAVAGLLQGTGFFALDGLGGVGDHQALQVFLALSAGSALVCTALATERRTATTRLRDSDERYRAYVDNSSEAIWCLELDKPMPTGLPIDTQIDWIINNARLSEANEAAKHLYRAYSRSKGELIGCLLFTDSEDYGRKQDRKYIRAFVEQGHKLRGFRTRRLLRAGGEGIIESRIVGHIAKGRLTRIWGTDVDVTQKLMAKLALEETEERFSKAFNSTPVAIVLTDLQTMAYMDVNRGFELLSGFRADEVIGKTALDIGLWKDPAVREQLVERVVREGSFRDVEIEYRTRDGRDRFGLFSAEAFELGVRKVLVSSIQDITDLRMTERALRQSEERFFKTFHKSPDAIVISTFDEDRYVDVNEAFEAMFGYRRDELIGRTASEINRWVDQEQKERLWRTIREAGSVSNVEVEFRTRSGERQIGIVSAESVDMSQEAFVVATIRDVTSQRRAESALLKSRELITKAFRNSPDAILISEISSGRILEANEGFLSMTGLTRDEVIGENAAQIGYWKDLERRAVLMDAMRREGRLSQVEVTYLNQAGEEIIASYSGELIEMDSKVCIVSVSRDITQRKQIEAVVEAYQNRLKTLASKLTLAEEGVRLKTAAELHDGLCQDLAAMIMRLGVLRGSLDGHDQIDTIDTVLDVLKKAMRSARNIVNDMSQQQMLERGLAPAIRSMAENVAERDGFEFTLIDDEQPRPLAESVQIVLYRSVRELLMNISKYARAGRVFIRIEKDPDEVLVTVSDDGVGFDAGSVDRDLGMDSGFGLFSIRQQVEWLGGSVDIQSGAGSGTTVVLRAPLDQAYARDDEVVATH